jgi:hypothetical protein
MGGTAGGHKCSALGSGPINGATVFFETIRAGFVTCFS